MRTEDGSIVQECLNGDPSAFGVLVDKYKAGIYAFVYDKLHSFRDAQDVTQEVFGKAYVGLRGLRNWESFSFWLFRIARNLCKNWIRDQSRRPDREYIEDQDPALLEAHSISSYRDNQKVEFLHEALDSLPDSYREVLLLHYFGGMTIKDMARSLGASPKAIGMRLSRARAELKEEVVIAMGSAFRRLKLQSNFTFRVVESVKRIKIPPVPKMAGLPWGLSLAVGIIITALSLNPYVSITSKISESAGFLLPAEAKVLENGEIPVDIFKADEISFISSSQADGNVGKTLFQSLQNAFFLAPHAKGGTWSTKADMPTGRMHLCASAVNGKIYAIGGGQMRGLEQPISTVEEYDPSEDKWDEMSDMRRAEYYLSSCVVDGKIYVIGGGSPGSFVVEEYDPSKDEWAKKADIATPRGDLSIGAVDGKIYAIGGWDGNEYVSTVEEYDTTLDLWTDTKKADMPTPRGGFSASVVNGKIYAIGGWDGTKYVSVVEEYDPKTDTWIRKANMPTIRGGLSACVLDDKIYAIGGWNRSTELPNVEEYDPVTDTWTRKSNMLAARALLATSVVNDKIYAIGGYRGGLHLSTVEEYDPAYVNVEARGKLPTTWGEEKSD